MATIRCRVCLLAAVVAAGAGCKKKEPDSEAMSKANDMSGAGSAASAGLPITCPGDHTQNGIVTGTSRPSSERIELRSDNMIIYSSIEDVPTGTYLTIYGQRGIGGAGDYYYDTLDCVDYTTRGRWHKLSLVDASGAGYVGLRFKMWSPSHMPVHLQIERAQDRHDGLRGPIKTITLPCSDGPDIDDTLAVTIVLPSGSAGSNSGSNRGSGAR